MDWRDKAAQPKQTQPKIAAPQESHYTLLGLHPSASVQEIRSAYRELSKRYHPDTTQLAADVATQKFQQLNQAYAVLSSPERRLLYDQSNGYSRIAVVQAPPDLNKATVWGKRYVSSSAYLDPTDRPLSAGEIFALFILGLTVLGCLMLAIAIGITRGDSAFQPVSDQPPSSLTVTVPSSKAAPVRKSALIAKPSQPTERPQPLNQSVPSTKPAQPVVPPLGSPIARNSGLVAHPSTPIRIFSTPALSKPPIPSPTVPSQRDAQSSQERSTGLSTEGMVTAEPITERTTAQPEAAIATSTPTAPETASLDLRDRPVSSPGISDESPAVSPSATTTDSNPVVSTPAAKPDSAIATPTPTQISP